MSTALKRSAASVALLVILIAGSVVAASPASANGSGCRIISSYSYVCTTVAGSGTYVSTSSVVYSTPGLICGTSAYLYVIYPWGQVSGLGYQSRGNCVYNRAYFSFGLSRNFPSGSLVCGKFMTFGNSVGPEPCVRIT